MNENVVIKQKSNKGVIVLLIIVIVGLIGYIAYDKTISNKVDNNETNTNEVSNNNETKEDKKEIKLKDKSKDVVYDLVNKNNNIQGENVIYQLPYINIDSKYVDEVNNKIKNLNQEKDEEEYPADLFYKYYLNNNILSVIIELKSVTDYTEEYTYNIDVYTGEYISNYELMKIKNMTDEDIIKKLDDYSLNNKVSHSREGAVADTLKFNELFLGSSMYLNENNELCVTAFYQPEAGGLAPYSYIYNIDQNKEIILTK